MKINKKRFWIWVVGAAGLLILFTQQLPAFLPDFAVQIRLGTLAPTGTSYHRILLEMGEKWRQASSGTVKLIIYPDGRQGGEADMVRKMRAGQLMAGMFTAVGISEIDNSAGCLQFMPMMFRSWDEVDYVREKLRPLMESRLLEKGFVVLCWGDAGWVRFFSKAPAFHPEDFKKFKIFAWAGDVFQGDLMKALGYHPVALETADILPSLQSGLINCIPTTSFYALAGQIDGSAAHLLALKWAPMVGAALIKREVWEKIPSEVRESAREAAVEAGQRIRVAARDEDEKSIVAMQKRGLQVHEVSPEVEAEWRSNAELIYPKIRGKMVPTDMFDEVRRLLEERRLSEKGAVR